MRQTLRGTLLLPFVLAVLFASATLALAATAVGKVEHAEGGVSVRRDGASQALKKADTVQVGDTIITATDGKASLRFQDDTVLVIAQSSQTRIDDYVYEGSSSKLLFRFAKGSFRAVTGKIVQKNPQGFNMQTPLATLGIRGSDVFALVQPDAESHGALDLGSGHTLELQSNQGKSSIKEGGLFSRVTPDGFVSTPQRIPPAMLSIIADTLSSPAAPPIGGGSGGSGSSSGGSSGASGSGGMQQSVAPQLPVITPTVTPAPAKPTTPGHYAS